jgi:two-component sensor histidine kinase
MLLEDALDSNQLLLKELQHRAKNSFSMISSLINLMSMSSKEEIIKNAFLELNSRVRAFSEMYDLLFTSDSVIDIRLDEYLNKIIYSLQKTKHIAFSKTLYPITVPVKCAISIGIIVTEIITNSIKYAFPENQNGEIKIKLNVIKNNITLIISDNGIGLPEDFDISKAHSLGLNLVNDLVKQIDGKYCINNKNGVEFNITLPCKE